MLQKIVLCAFPSRLTAGFWRMGRLVSCEGFPNDEQGLNAFRDFLQRHKRIPISLISDAVEEDYRVEAAPHTTGNARRALLARKLGQLHRNALYRAAQFIGRASGNRKDDLFLFVAQSNADSIQPWVQVMEEQDAPLVGVYLLPMVSQFLIDRLKLGNPHLLLADCQVSGLRQTYFQDGKLRVSRLAPNEGITEDNRAQFYLAETEKTRLYLSSQRLIAPDTKLSLLVLSRGADGDEICRQIGSEPNVECMALDANKLAASVGLSAGPLQQFPELLYMQVVAGGHAPVNLAPAEQVRNFRLHQLRILIGYASAVLLLGGVLLAAHNFNAKLNYDAESAQARAQTLDYERRYREVASDFPATALPGDDLKIAVELKQALAANTQTPRRLMQVIAAALDAAPEIQLQRLRWKLTDDLNAKDDVSTQGTQAAPATAAAPTAGSPSGVLRELGFVEGEISDFSGDYRAALESVTRLAERLQKNAQVEQVVIMQQPVNVDSYSNLQGSTLDAQTQQMPAAEFKLKIILKPATQS